nr:coiled-coil domain-containing protein 192 isoform X6 [Microcebus murinus]
MGECYSKNSVLPESETAERSSTSPASSESDTQQKSQVLGKSLDTGQMPFNLAHLRSLEICLEEAEEKARALSEQLAVSDGTKSKLLRQVSLLEEKLETMVHKEASEEAYEKMVLVKDQCIEKLQAEVKASQEQLIAHAGYLLMVPGRKARFPGRRGTSASSMLLKECPESRNTPAYMLRMMTCPAALYCKKAIQRKESCSWIRTLGFPLCHIPEVGHI